MKTIVWSMLAVVVAMMIMVPLKSQAATFDEQLIAASTNLPLGADVASMGNVGTVEEFSSANPAVSAIMKQGFAIGTVNYAYLQFEKTRLQTISGSVTGKLGDAVLQIGFGHGESPMSWLNEFEAFRIKESNTLDVQLGGKIFSGLLGNDELYAGMGYTFAKSSQEGIFITPTPATAFVNEVALDSDSHTATVGFAYKPIKQVTVGVFGSRTWTSSQFMVNGWQDPEAFETFYDVGHLGFSAKIFEGTTLAADYQRLSFSSSDTTFDQYHVGIEQYIMKDFLALYVGVDNDAPTTGIGMYFPNGGINLSYGHHVLKEVRSSFGKGDAYGVSLYFNF